MRITSETVKKVPKQILGGDAEKNVGHPPEEILNAADEEGCDVIVLGTHGKGFLAHAFLGSVSNAVLHRARKPVFTIPLPSEKTTFDWDGI